MTPAVTVVVPTTDRVELLARCLRGLANQDVPDVEVVVVHDGNRAVEELLADWPKVHALRIDQRGAAAKRNAGWCSGQAPLIAFTDDDCEPAPGWLGALCRGARPAGTRLVAGPVAPHPEDSAVSGLWARTVRSREPGLYPGCNLLLTRTALQESGGFDLRLSAGEDTDLAWRVLEGGRATWAEDALVWHAVRPVTFAGQLRSLPRWSSLPLVVRRHPGLRRAFAHRRLFWKDSHPAACLALAGLVLAAWDKRALAAGVPLLLRRVRASGPRDGLALAANDLAEVAVLAAGSLRHRSLLL